MKKFFLILLAFIAVAITPSAIMANDNIPTGVTETSSMSGTLDVQMGDHTNSFSNFSNLSVTENADSTINIVINDLQIGSMPGKISINATNIPLDGIADEYAEVVTFKFLGTSYYDAEILAEKKADGKLYFKITTIGAKYLGIPFTAIVEFNQD